jgi:hypothetical protein
MQALQRKCSGLDFDGRPLDCSQSIVLSYCELMADSDQSENNDLEAWNHWLLAVLALTVISTSR